MIILLYNISVASTTVYSVILFFSISCFKILWGVTNILLSSEVKLVLSLNLWTCLPTIDSHFAAFLLFSVRSSLCLLVIQHLAKMCCSPWLLLDFSTYAPSPSFYSMCTKFITWLDEALFLCDLNHMSLFFSVIKHHTLSPVITLQSILSFITELDFFVF